MYKLWSFLAFGIVTTIGKHMQSRKSILVQNAEFYVHRNFKNVWIYHENLLLSNEKQEIYSNLNIQHFMAEYPGMDYFCLIIVKNKFVQLSSLIIPLVLNCHFPL